MCFVVFLMIRRPPRSTQSRSSAAADVYKRQRQGGSGSFRRAARRWRGGLVPPAVGGAVLGPLVAGADPDAEPAQPAHVGAVADTGHHVGDGVTHRRRRAHQFRVVVQIVTVDEPRREHAQVLLPRVPRRLPRD